MFQAFLWSYSFIVTFVISVLILLILGNAVNAQTWSKKFEYPIAGSTNIGYAIEKHPDGFLIQQVGNPGSLLEEGQHIGTILLNSDGDVIGNSSLNAIGVNYFIGPPSCMDINDTGFIITAGFEDINNDPGNFYAQIQHYNLTQELIQSYTHQSPLYGSESVIFSSSGGYVFTGSSRNTPNSTLGAFIMKLDENMDYEWENVIPGSAAPNETEIYGWNVINAHDGGYLVTAAERFLEEYDECVFTNYKRNRVLFKFDSQGDLEWTKEWDNCYAEGPFNIIPTSDGMYLISTGTVVQEISNPDYIRWKLTLIKIDQNGDEIWNKSYGNDNANARLRAAVETDNGNYVAVGFKYGPPLLYLAGVILKVDSSGDSLWMREVQWAPNTYSKFNDVIEDGTGGYVACGEVQGFNEGSGIDTWVVRFDSEGCVQGDCFVGVEEQVAKPQLTVCPNPALDFLTIELPEMAIAYASLEVYSITGALVHSQLINQPRIVLSVGDWARGLYLIQVKANNRILRSKVVVD